jgi:hypothetical protein
MLSDPSQVLTPCFGFLTIFTFFDESGFIASLIAFKDVKSLLPDFPFFKSMTIDLPPPVARQRTRLCRCSKEIAELRRWCISKIATIVALTAHIATACALSGTIYLSPAPVPVPAPVNARHASGSTVAASTPTDRTATIPRLRSVATATANAAAAATTTVSPAGRRDADIA